MFGYLRVNQDELKIREARVYRAWYCGLCEALKKRHGQLSRFTLTYDMTFLAMLLQGLYEEKEEKAEKRCLPHPIKKHMIISSKATEYAADMNVLLCYYDLLDDWEDEKKPGALLLAKSLEKTFKKTFAAYGRQAGAIQSYLKELKQCEKEKSRDIDLAAGLTGRLMGEIFVMQEDAFAENIRRLGFYLGKFIYLMDAYEDAEADLKKGSYNPFSVWYQEEDFEKKAKSLLTLIMADAAREFEKLPIEENLDILRNILYCGVWTKYTEINNKKENEK